MMALPWLLLWFGAGTPICTLFYLRKLHGKIKADYAYYLEWRGFPKWRTAIAKLAPAFCLGWVFSQYQSLGPVAILPVTVYLGCSAIVESIVLIGRPHLTPMYRSSGHACENCRSGRDQRCSNVRMLDSFETGFRSSRGRYRPVCCCGFRLSEWRELLA